MLATIVGFWVGRMGGLLGFGLVWFAWIFFVSPVLSSLMSLKIIVIITVFLRNINFT